MHRTLFSAAVALVLLAGCSTTTARAPEAPSVPEPTTASEETTTTTVEATTDTAPTTAEAITETAKTPRRRIGEFVTFRFSGSFRKHPITLTERVLARAGTILTMEYAFDDGAKKDTFRVRVDEAAVEGQILAVTKIEGAKETPSTPDALDAMLAKTVLVADRNDAALGSEGVTMQVAGKSLAATKATFSVRIGKKAATMTVIRSDAFAWGDVGGEIATKDGTVLYKAEIVDSGRTGTTAGALASSDDDE